LSRMNDLPLCTNYNDIRSQKLEKLYFSAGSTKNIKITTKDDIAIFKAMISF